MSYVQEAARRSGACSNGPDPALRLSPLLLPRPRLAALVVAGFLVAAGAPAAEPELVVRDETPEGLELTWTPRPGAAPRVERLVLPTGHSALLQVEGLAHAPGPTALSGALRVTAAGRAGRVPVARLHLDAGQLPAALLGQAHRVRIRFVPNGPGLGDGVPPAARGDATLASGAARGLRATGRGRLLNPVTAERVRATVASDPTSWPRAGVPTPRVALRRRLAPRAHAVGGRREGSSLTRDRLDGLGAGRVKIVVDRDGIHRIRGVDLEALGVDLGGLGVDDLRLITRAPDGGVPRDEFQDPPLGAVEVDIHVRDVDGDGRFDPEDHFEFWGLALTRDRRPGFFQGADFTDRNAYVLDGGGCADCRMAPVSAPPTQPPAADFLATARWEEDTFFLGNHLTGEFDIDHYYSCPSISWATGEDATRIIAIALPGLDPSSSRPAALRARLLARTSSPGVDPDHRAMIEIGATTLTDQTSEGFTVDDHEATGLAASLLSPLTEVTVRIPGVPGVASDRFEVDWIEIDHPRSFEAMDDALVLQHPLGVSIPVTGLSSDDVTVLDVTDPAAPFRLADVTVGGGAASFDLVRRDPGDERDRVVAVQAFGAGPAPAALEWMPETDLRDPARRADLVVIGPRTFLEPPSATLTAWVAAKEADGTSVLLVAFEDLVDEFRDGIWSPFALSSYFLHAVATWDPEPRHALLLGDTTTDYKNLLDGRILLGGDCSPLIDECGFHETDWVQHVPTRVIDNPADTQFLSYYASDVVLTLVAGDDWEPDIVVGRLPARTRGELDAMLAKALAYRDLAAAPPPWAGHVLMVGDRIQNGGEAVIETSQDDAHAEHLAPHYTRTTFYYQTDYGAMNPDVLTADLLADWQDPAASGAVVSYVGHGSTFRWSGSWLLTNNRLGGCRNDVEDLTGPAIPTPFVLNANCITGAFMHLVAPSLLEELVRAPEGGAIGAYGPTGITFLSDAPDIIGTFFGVVHGAGGRSGPVGDAVREVQAVLVPEAELGRPEELLSNVLLGDPSLDLVVPHGPAGLGLVATAGDAEVSVSWDAVPGAESYDLHRSEGGPAGPWVVVESGLAAPERVDADVTNGTTYCYAAEPFAAGWPGRWSSVDCAVPCSDVPPEPPGPVNAPEGDCFGRMVLTWPVSPSVDVAGYWVRVYRGAEPVGAPEQVVQAVTGFAIIENLVPFRPYTFVVTAFSSCDVESAPTEPVMSRATCPLELDRPAFISDLMVTSQAGDVVLDWSPVTRTVQGMDLTPAEYRVYRAEVPTFLADAGTRVGRPATPGFTDPGRVGNGVRLECWGVAAMAPRGERGAVGHDFPQGVRDVQREELDPATWRLTWPRASFDIQGWETPVVSWDVHASAAPLTRAEVEGRMPEATVTAPEALVPMGLDFYVVVPRDVHGNSSLD